MISLATLLIGFIATLGLLFLLESYLTFPIIVDLLICYVFVFVLMYLFFLVNINTTKNINKIEKQFLKNRKHPYYRFIYAISNKEDKQVILSYRKMVKQKKYHRFYPLITIIFSLYFNKTMALEEEVEKLSQPSVKKFYKAWILIEQNQLKEAENIADSMKKVWMKEALISEVKLKKGEIESAKRHAETALKHARGIQYYSLKKEFERKYEL